MKNKMNRKIILSLVLAISGYFLGIVADANHNSDSAIYPATCLTKILFFLIAVPLAYSAGKNIRKESNVTGIPGLRFMSWTMYGVAIGHYALFFQWPLIALGNSQLPDGQITVDSAIFFIASMLMIAEAWNSYKSKDYPSSSNLKLQEVRTNVASHDGASNSLVTKSEHMLERKRIRNFASKSANLGSGRFGR